MLSPMQGPSTQVLLTKQESDVPNKAATSSAGVIRGVLRNPADLQQFKVLQNRITMRVIGCCMHVKFQHARATALQPTDDA